MVITPSEATLETARRFLAQMGKDCIVVNDLPGFVSNRVLMLTINEAVYVLQDGVATAGQVDQIFKTCFGHKIGPLDLIGLDTILYSIEAYTKATATVSTAPASCSVRWWTPASTAARAARVSMTTTSPFDTR